MSIRDICLPCAIALFFILLLSPTRSAADLDAALLANPCAGCHGTDGKSAGSIPSIHQMSAFEIAQAMLDFKTDTRQGTVMNRIAKGYNDAQITTLAEYFGRVNKKPEQ